MASGVIPVCLLDSEEGSMFLLETTSSECAMDHTICDLLADRSKIVLFVGQQQERQPFLHYAGVERFPGGGSGKAIKSHITLHLVVRGQAWCGSPEQPQTLCPGDALLTSPFQRKWLEADPQSECIWAWVAFSDATLMAQLQAHGIAPIQPLLSDGDDPWLLDLTAILRELHAPGPRPEVEWRARLDVIGNRILRCFGRETEPAATAGRHEAVAAALRMIANDQGASLTAGMLAHAVGLDRSYFSRLFKQETGQSVRQAIQQERLRQAQALLRRDDLSLAAVAELLGFDAYYSFFRFFSRQAGMNPSEYRQR
jgi:AraC-like DNA-binding protein